jgi:hypothetical protein
MRSTTAVRLSTGVRESFESGKRAGQAAVRAEGERRNSPTLVTDQRCIEVGWIQEEGTAFPLVRADWWGLGGVEPPTSSLSAITRSPLCNPAFSQVVRVRKGRSNALFERASEGRLGPASESSRRARATPDARCPCSKMPLTCTESRSAQPTPHPIPHPAAPPLNLPTSTDKRTRHNG